MHEIQRPLFVRRCGLSPRLADPHQTFAPLPFYAHSGGAVNAEQPFVIHAPSLPTDQHPQTAIAVAWFFLRQLDQPFPQRFVSLRVSLEAIRGSWNLGQLAGPAHASVKSCPQMLSVLTPYFALRP